MYNADMISKNLKDTEKIALDLLHKIHPHASKATVVALSGELGSGKTTFAKAFAQGLGIKEEDVTSPTFVIMKMYELGGRNHFKKFIHIDAYRLEKAEEIEKLGWHEMLLDHGNLILVEWPENISKVLPQDAVKVEFTFLDENTREINYK